MAGQGRGSEALALHTAAHSGLIEQLGANHPYVLVVERNRLKTRQGVVPEQVEPGAAAELVRRHEELLGADHPDTQKARALLEG